MVVHPDSQGAFSGTGQCLHAPVKRRLHQLNQDTWLRRDWPQEKRILCAEYQERWKVFHLDLTQDLAFILDIDPGKANRAVELTLKRLEQGLVSTTVVAPIGAEANHLQGICRVRVAAHAASVPDQRTSRAATTRKLGQKSTRTAEGERVMTMP